MFSNADKGDVYVFNLLNGSEIIAKIDFWDDNFFYLTNAFQFTISQKNPGEMHVGLAPAAHFADQSDKGNYIRLSKSAIVTIYAPAVASRKTYDNFTRTIVIASPNSILNQKP